MARQEKFLEEVKSYIRSKEAKRFVTRELEAHLKQSKSDFIKNGYGEEEAEKQAVANMGSPMILGQKLNQLHRPKIDWSLITLFISVIAIGILPFFVLMTEETHLSLFQKLASVVIGIGIVVITLLFDYTKWKKYGWLFFGLGCAVILYAQWSGVLVNGRTYLHIPGIIASDMMITLPLFLLGWAGLLANKKINIYYVSILYIVSLGLFLNTASFVISVIYSVMVWGMVWNSHLERKKVALASAAYMVGVIGVMVTAIFSMKEYQLARLKGFLHPEQYSLSEGYYYVLAKGVRENAGWFGTSEPPGLAEPFSDFVFLALTYRLGWLFGLFLIVILLLLLARMIIVLTKVKDSFGRLLVTGSVGAFLIQIVLNIGMSFGVVPAVSVALPFVSYGTAYMIVNSFMMGVVLSVYRKKDLILLAER
ncbi:FtsW/RodA/SpoVE family cell cycle protein [Peribacillus sp. Hz7]|uniref:FtsW/RodA/SpoVE family cell cycle protein n=1 Tax=Peribacillus sp. Hz7 TaxID=3344873 RepID=UPI0035CA45AF